MLNLKLGQNRSVNSTLVVGFFLIMCQSFNQSVNKDKSILYIICYLEFCLIQLWYLRQNPHECKWHQRRFDDHRFGRRRRISIRPGSFRLQYRWLGSYWYLHGPVQNSQLPERWEHRNNQAFCRRRLHYCSPKTRHILYPSLRRKKPRLCLQRHRFHWQGELRFTGK